VRIELRRFWWRLLISYFERRFYLTSVLVRILSSALIGKKAVLVEPIDPLQGFSLYLIIGFIMTQYPYFRGSGK